MGFLLLLLFFFADIISPHVHTSELDTTAALSVCAERLMDESVLGR